MQRKIISRKLPENFLGFSEDIHPVLQRVYAARGIQSESELDRNLEKLLPYDNLQDIEKAAIYLADTIASQKRLLIIGDFDADGATSSALAVSALRKLGAENVAYLVPNRFEYGYGLTPEIVKVAEHWKPDVIITVDNGISSVSGVDAANAAGINVVITDHHLPGNELPKAVAIVNPNQRDDHFPSKCLAGVGVIFYVMLALRRELLKRDWFNQKNIAPVNMSQFLDLVALGTVADVVPLDHNNRVLVHQGLQRIRAGKTRPGILALLTLAKRERSLLSSTDLAFAVAPRLNAAGRLDDMSLGIECLLCDDTQQALLIARQLDELNVERRAIEMQMQEEAYLQLEKLHLEKIDALPHGLCLYQEDWHQGVIGILAGRVKEKYHRPVIAFAKVDDHTLKGSARSIPGLHIRDLLDVLATKYPTLISKFGGHAMAAGLSISLDNLNVFAKVFSEEVTHRIDENDLESKLLTDGGLSDEHFTLELAELLRDAGPWGQEFPAPLFEGEFIIVNQRLVAEKHLKLSLKKLDSDIVSDAIFFNIDRSRWPNENCKKVHVVYRLEINEYQGLQSVQLIVENLVGL